MSFQCHYFSLYFWSQINNDTEPKKKKSYTHIKTYEATRYIREHLSYKSFMKAPGFCCSLQIISLENCTTCTWDLYLHFKQKIHQNRETTQEIPPPSQHTLGTSSTERNITSLHSTAALLHLTLVRLVHFPRAQCFVP